MWRKNSLESEWVRAGEARNIIPHSGRSSGLNFTYPSQQETFRSFIQKEGKPPILARLGTILGEMYSLMNAFGRAQPIPCMESLCSWEGARAGCWPPASPTRAAGDPENGPQASTSISRIVPELDLVTESGVRIFGAMFTKLWDAPKKILWEKKSTKLLPKKENLLWYLKLSRAN